MARVCAGCQSLTGYRFKLGGGLPTHTICYSSRRKKGLQRFANRVNSFTTPRYFTEDLKRLIAFGVWSGANVSADLPVLDPR